ncbi:MAG: histidine kinase [Frankiales bacterium]|nr:histidine kinase [Frankiales bacterium]
MRPQLALWWDRRGLRARLVLSAAVPLAVALVIGTVAVAALFAAGRVRDLDEQTRVEADTLTALISSGQLPTTLPLPAGSPLLAQVLSADGSVAAASPSASRVLPLVAREQASRSTVVTDEAGSYAGVPLRIRVHPATLNGLPVRVVVAAPLGDVRRALRALRVVLVVVVPLLVLTTTWLVYLVAGLALRPVEQLRTAAEQMARNPAGEPSALPVLAGDDEIARLARTLNGLLGSLQALVAQQQAFVADAAHELRSPLAGIRVQLEVAQAHPQLVVLPVLLDELGHDVERLGGLVDDLLALARMESGQRLGLVPVDLRSLAHAEGDAVQVLGDPAALQRLVDNLRSNAERHATQVVLTTSREGHDAVLDVDDDGPGIPPGDRERVFDRWVRLDASRARADGGTGLGLALVREIARRHDGDVVVVDSPLGGARLRVRIPLLLPHVGEASTASR